MNFAARVYWLWIPTRAFDIEMRNKGDVIHLLIIIILNYVMHMKQFNSEIEITFFSHYNNYVYV